MDARGRLWFPWLHFLSSLGWLQGRWVPFPRGAEQGKGQRRTCVGQRGPREGAEGRVSSHRKTKGCRTRGKCRSSSSWRGAGVQDSCSFRTAMQDLLQAGRARGRRVWSAGGLRAPCPAVCSQGTSAQPPQSLLGLPHAKAKPRAAGLSLPLSLPVPAVSPGSALGFASIYLPAWWIFSKGKGTARRGGGCLPFRGALANKSHLQPLHRPAR